jgi:hypothetical protein
MGDFNKGVATVTHSSPASQKITFTFHKYRKYQCCGSGMFIPDRSFSIPKSKRHRIRIRNKEFKYFKPKKLIRSSRKYDLGCLFRISVPRSGFFHPGSSGLKAPDPGSGSATLVNAVPMYCKLFGTGDTFSVR